MSAFNQADPPKGDDPQGNPENEKFVKPNEFGKVINGLYHILIDEATRRFKFQNLGVVILVAVTLVCFFQDNAEGRLQSVEGLVRATLKVLTIAVICLGLALFEKFINFQVKPLAQVHERKHASRLIVGTVIVATVFFATGVTCAYLIGGVGKLSDKVSKAIRLMNEAENLQRADEDARLKKHIEKEYGPAGIPGWLSGSSK